MSNDSIRVICRSRRAAPRRGRTAAAIIATAALAPLATACNGSPPSTGSGGPPNAGGAAGSPAASSPAAGSPAASVSPELAFARCVRTHGVPNWPDPGSGGSEPASARQIAASNPQFPAAQTACVHLLPNGGQPTNTQIQADLRNAVRFAGCMRTHGVPNFPDPDPASDGGRVNLFASALAAGIDMSSQQVMATAQKCGSLLHIDLGSIGMG